MLFVPLPFVVTFLLLLLLLRLYRETGFSGAARPFAILMGGYALLSVISGLRWGYGETRLLPLMLQLAAALPPLAWVAFRKLTSARRNRFSSIVHVAPVILIAILLVLWPDAIDFALMSISLGYGGALLLLSWRGPDALDRVPLESVRLIHRSLQVTAIMLIMSAFIDVVIAIDFVWLGGRHAASYVTAANLIGLFVLGAAAATAATSEASDPAEEQEALQDNEPNDEERSIAQRVESLVVEQRLYRDPDLTLNRLARKTLIPTRRISSAINRAKGQSVSRFINGHRVAEACRLLENTESPITTIMFESGFQTKSNFNREFRDRTGQSPVQWRQGRKLPG